MQRTELSTLRRIQSAWPHIVGASLSSQNIIKHSFPADTTSLTPLVSKSVRDAGGLNERLGLFFWSSPFSNSFMKNSLVFRQWKRAPIEEETRDNSSKLSPIWGDPRRKFSFTGNEDVYNLFGVTRVRCTHAPHHFAFEGRKNVFMPTSKPMADDSLAPFDPDLFHPNLLPIGTHLATYQSIRIGNILSHTNCLTIDLFGLWFSVGRPRLISADSYYLFVPSSGLASIPHRFHSLLRRCVMSFIFQQFLTSNFIVCHYVFTFVLIRLGALAFLLTPAFMFFLFTSFLTANIRRLIIHLIFIFSRNKKNFFCFVFHFFVWLCEFCEIIVSGTLTSVCLSMMKIEVVVLLKFQRSEIVWMPVIVVGKWMQIQSDTIKTLTMEWLGLPVNDPTLLENRHWSMFE